MSDTCPLCNTPERRHTAECSEGVPNRVGYFRGMPVVPDLEEDFDMPLLKSDPMHEPNHWHAKPSAVAKLREMGELKETL